jgi:hypothetical protein
MLLLPILSSQTANVSPRMEAKGKGVEAKQSMLDKAQKQM